MYQPVALFIGLRYMRGRASDRFGRFVSWLSAIGITLGVMALVTVLSVMNGLEHQLEQNTLGLMPQALVTSDSGSINPQTTPAVSLHLNGISNVTPLSPGEVVMLSAPIVCVAVLLVFYSYEPDPLTPYLINVSQL